MHRPSTVEAAAWCLTHSGRVRLSFSACQVPCRRAGGVVFGRGWCDCIAAFARSARGLLSMLRWIVDGSLRLRRTVVAAAVALTVFGVWQFRSIHADVLPEFAPPTVHIQTEALGLSAAEVEQLITVPLEQ